MKILVVLLSTLFLLAACNREGPAEKAGRSIDQAGRDASRSLEKAGDSIRDAAKGKK
jgi:hypothetical protein